MVDGILIGNFSQQFIYTTVKRVSRARSAAFVAIPPAKPVSDPSAPTTHDGHYEDKAFAVARQRASGLAERAPWPDRDSPGLTERSLSSRQTFRLNSCRRAEAGIEAGSCAGNFPKLALCLHRFAAAAPTSRFKLYSFGCSRSQSTAPKR